MTTALAALRAFFSGFGIPAYVAGALPLDEPELPYLTYDPRETTWGGAAPMSARVWYPGTNYRGAAQLVDRIEAALGHGGVTIPVDGGTVIIAKGSPFAQPQDIGNKNVKVIYLNFLVNTMTAERRPDNNEQI